MDVLYFLGKAGLITAIFFCCYKAFLERETFYVFNRHFLLAGLLASLLLPLFIFSQTVYVEPISASALDMALYANGINENSENALESFWTTSYFVKTLLYMYASGVLFFCLRFGLSLFRVLRFCTCLPAKAGEHDSFKEKGLRYIAVSGLPAPFSFFNTIVYDPEASTAEELELILAHERQHAHQRHSVDLLLGRFMCVLFWFNPLQWFYARAIEQNLEYMADAKVAELGFPRKAYQLALVQVSYGQTPALTQSFYQSLIKKRIIMLNKNRSNQLNKFKALFLLPVLALFLWGFNVEEVQVIKNASTGDTSVTAQGENLISKGLNPINQVSAVSSSKVFANSSTTKTDSKGQTEQRNETSALISTTKNAIDQDESFRYVIKRNSTKAELDALATKLKQDNQVELDYSSLDYNSTGIITSIKIKMKDLTKDNKVNFNRSSTDGIDDIIVFRDENGGLGCTSTKTTSQTSITRSSDDGASSMSTTTNQERKQEINARKTAMEQRRITMEAKKANLEAREKELDKQREELQTRQEQMEERQSKLDVMQQELERQTAEVQKRNDASVSLKPKNTMKIDDNILILVDGKQESREYMDKIDPETIKSINVIKGKDELKAFGKKAEGKTGVIEITTKKGDTE